MQLSRQLPTIEELIVRGRTGPDAYERPIITQLNTLLLDSIVPLVLLTDADLRQLEGIGPKRRQFIRERIEETNSITMRTIHESVIKRATTIFNDIDNVPIQALTVIPTQMGLGTISTFVPSPALRQMVTFDATMTIGELTSLRESELGEYFDAHGAAIDKHHTYIMASELRNRLSAWELSFKRQRVSTKVS